MGKKERDLISQAIICAIKQDYFYGSVLAKFNYIEDSSIGTIGVRPVDNRVHCMYNPEFISKQTIFGLSLILMHEILHIIFQHHARQGDRETVLWNVAADLAVNSLIDIENVFEEAIVPGDYGFGYGLTAESYYDRLLADGSKIESGSSQTDGSVPIIIDGVERGKYVPLQSPHEGSVEEYVLNSCIQKAYERALEMGYNPGNQVSEAMKVFGKPELNWKTILHRFLGMKNKGDRLNTYTRPNRRLGFGCKGHIISRTPRVVFIIDTSASIEDETLSEILNELETARKTLNIEIEVIECDASVQKHYKFNSDKKITLGFYGRGGTDFRPAFNYIKSKNIKPDCAIYFTDLFGIFPDKFPPYSVLWIQTSNVSMEVPFGKILQLHRR